MLAFSWVVVVVRVAVLDLPDDCFEGLNVN